MVTVETLKMDTVAYRRLPLLSGLVG